MDNVVGFDPALAGFWPVGRAAVYEPRLEEAVRMAMLETKSELSPVEEMQTLLNAMNTELRQQFEMFRTIRAQAGRKLDGDDAEAKLARADGKAAVDALALITRTLEKIDGLQRGLADTLARQAEEDFDDAAYQALLADIDRKIAERAGERARSLLAEWTAAAADGTGPPGADGQAGGRARSAAGGGPV